jgi:hypothetical protein
MRRCPVAIIQVVECPALTLPEECLAAESQTAVGAYCPAARVDSSRLRRFVELKLVVGGNVPRALKGVGKNAALEGQVEVAVLPGAELQGASYCAGNRAGRRTGYRAVGADDFEIKRNGARVIAARGRGRGWDDQSCNGLCGRRSGEAKKRERAERAAHRELESDSKQCFHKRERDGSNNA